LYQNVYQTITPELTRRGAGCYDTCYLRTSRGCNEMAFGSERGTGRRRL